MLLTRCKAFLLAGLVFGCSDDGSSSDSTNTSNTSATGSTTVTSSNTTSGTTDTTTASTTGSTTGSTTTGSTTTGSTTTGTTTGGTPTAPLPADSSAAAISAFLQAQSYTDATWTSFHDAPYTPPDIAWHGTVRVYMSPAVMEFRATTPDVSEPPAVPGAMAVKEFYDDQGNMVGHAAIYYAADAPVYYCYGPAGRCYSSSADTTMDAPEWFDSSAGTTNQCGTCHGGAIYTEMP